jgi:hypothetical protein
VSDKYTEEITPIKTCDTQEHLRLAAQTKLERCPECQKPIFSQASVSDLVQMMPQAQRVENPHC